MFPPVTAAKKSHLLVYCT